jgi:hypothetical protein
MNYLTTIFVKKLLAALLVFAFMTPVHSQGLPKIMVYKSPTCGCCSKWVDHLEQEGFEVDARNHQNMNAVKEHYKIIRSHQSCHTAVVGGYLVEGHVPAQDIKRMLSEKPDIRGLSVPGMPMGSPGMEGHRVDKYDVLAIQRDNSSSIFVKH